MKTRRDYQERRDEDATSCLEEWGQLEEPLKKRSMSGVVEGAMCSMHCNHVGGAWENGDRHARCSVCWLGSCFACTCQVV